MNDLVSIGRFSRLSGLTIDALRHYDELGLLRPAAVDPETGYRRYRPGQLEDARRIGWLRSLELSLGAIGAWMAPDATEATRAAILRRHLISIEARATRLGRISHRLRMSIDSTEVPMTTPTAIGLDAAARRQLAVDLFNHVWTLLEIPHRTADQDDEMLHAAHASRYHWGEVGNAANRARGEWQCSRVYSVLGRAEPAIHHARRCLELCETNLLRDWDLAAAWEAIARASLVAGDGDALRRALREARVALEGIADAEDRRLIESDLDQLGTVGES
jgi:DNA-binding transcriptional MerR regulator